MEMGVCRGPFLRVLDLGLEAGEPEARRLRLVSQGRRASVEVSGASGALVVSSRLDREELCGKSAPCSLRLEVLVERPLRVFHVELEVTDINDNAPIFPATRKNLSVSESTPAGTRFPLEGASDADVGANAQLSYSLSPSEHFRVEEEDSSRLFGIGGLLDLEIVCGTEMPTMSSEFEHISQQRQCLVLLLPDVGNVLDDTIDATEFEHLESGTDRGTLMRSL
ncbi:hypothetical protein AAES_108026 [Amazona aestiva]|uniref:Cadherin domain-containing protein n=1 Tax=Amazona aestiva TaxID=12930 RepID=A0A0Q3PEF4_AMAAE|nr:hypothetical protein AAES_108026 [Amazona aestiva]